MTKSRLSKAVTSILTFAIGAVVVVIVLIPFFRNDVYLGNDLSFQISRIDGIISCIKDKQFPIAIYPYKNFGHGYASPLFYCDLFLIPFAIVKWVFNISLVSTYKLIVFVFVYLTVMNLYFSLKYFCKNRTAVLFGVIVLFTSNYYLADLYMRAALGEIMAIAFLPSLIVLIYKVLYIESKMCNSVLLGINFACILFCHNITFFISCVFFLFLIVLNIKKIVKNRKYIDILVSGCVGLLLSLFFSNSYA